MRYLLLVLLTLSISAEIKINKPLLKLVDANGVKVATDSTSIEKAMEKASSLSNGVYTLICPDITITVKNLVVAQTAPNKVTISWTAPTQNTDNTDLTDLAGFRVYYGTSEDDLSTMVSVTDTKLTLTDLEPDIYYFAVVAVNELDVESEFSNIASKKVL